MARRTTIATMVALAALVLLTACNPLPNQPTAVRFDGRTRSGELTYTGDRSGWLEVAIVAAPVDDLSVNVFGRDETRPIVPAGMSCFFGTSEVEAWRDGTSLGYQRFERIGPGTTFKVQAQPGVEGLVFDARVVDDDGNPVGDLTHVFDGSFESVGGAICP